ncbi:tyrosine-type recombinase/integrase [bacterium]|nr:tyrosine-type recombinase/integrase [candidate division CSSED10-310 bacterium]
MEERKSKKNKHKIPAEKPINLTKKVIESLPKPTNPRGKRYYYEKLQKFGVCVYPSGQKSFFVEYTVEKFGKKCRKFHTLGKFGKLTLDAAIKKAKVTFGKVSEGCDPFAEESDKSNGYLLSEWIDEYLEKIRHYKKGIREDLRYLGWAKEQWGDRPLNSLTPVEIEKYFLKIADSGRKTTANRWLASIRACLQEAWRKEEIVSNPAMKVKPLSEGDPRRRVLFADELERFKEALDRLPDIYAGAAFKLMLVSGARLSEVLNAKWEDIDFENKRWVLPNPKSGKRQFIPLTEVRRKILKDLPQLGLYVIAGKYPDKPRADLKRSWKSLLEMAELEKVTIHDLRRTFGLRYAKKHGLHIASKMLRHSDIRLTERHYAPFELPELTELAEDTDLDLFSGNDGNSDNQ